MGVNKWSTKRSYGDNQGLSLCYKNVYNRDNSASHQRLKCLNQCQIIGPNYR